MKHNQGVAIFGMIVFVITIAIFIAVVVMSLACRRRVIKDEPSTNQDEQFPPIGDEVQENPQ